MKIVCTSDTHGNLPEIPECDLFIHAGDFTPVSDHSIGFQTQWFTRDFGWWVKECLEKADQMIVVAGNHDFIAQAKPAYMHSPQPTSEIPGYTYLHNSSAEVGNFKIWGSPYSCRFGNWAFMRDENGLDEIWQTIPDDTNIVIVHGPPYSYGDKCMYYKGRDPHQGSISLMQRLRELPDLELVICGHIHEDSGVFTTPYCPIANVSYVDLNYKPRGHFYEFEI